MSKVMKSTTGFIANIFYRLDTFDKKKNTQNSIFFIVTSVLLMCLYALEEMGTLVYEGTFGFIAAPFYIIVPSICAILISSVLFRGLWLNKNVNFSFCFQYAATLELLVVIGSTIMIIATQQAIAEPETVKAIVYTYLAFVMLLSSIIYSVFIHRREKKIFENTVDDDDSDDFFDIDELENEENKKKYPYELKMVIGIFGNILKFLIYGFIRSFIAVGFLSGVLSII